MARLLAWFEAPAYSFNFLMATDYKNLTIFRNFTRATIHTNGILHVPTSPTAEPEAWCDPLH